MIHICGNVQWCSGKISEWCRWQKLRQHFTDVSKLSRVSLKIMSSFRSNKVFEEFRFHFNRSGIRLNFKQNSSTDILSFVIWNNIGVLFAIQSERAIHPSSRENNGLGWISNVIFSEDLSRYEFRFSGCVCQRVRGWPNLVVGPGPHATGDIDVGQNHDHNFGNQPSSSDKHSKDGFRFASVWTWNVWQISLI